MDDPASAQSRILGGSRSWRQSVETTESAGPWGYDAGKKIKGRKRHILTDAGGLRVMARVHTADIQDRDGAPDVLMRSDPASPGRATSSSAAAMPATSCVAPWLDAATESSRSSNDQTRPRTSCCCRADGSWSVSLLGSGETDAWPRTSRRPLRAQRLGSSWPRSS